MVRISATGRRSPVRGAALAAGLVACGLATLVLAAAVLPTAAPAATSVQSIQAQARAVKRSVARLDHRAELLTEKYDAARAALDAISVRLEQARSDLERTQTALDAAQALRSQRLVTMYKSGDYGLLDMLLSARSLNDAEAQLGYFRAIDRADQDTVTRITAMEHQIRRLADQIDADRADALTREMDLRGQQAAIEEQLAARQQLLANLDARVKKLLARQASLDAAASARLATAAGVDLAAIHGTPAQIAVVREAMGYLGVPYVWAGASPSGGFDCSGLVLYVYARFGVDFPHAATLQARMGTPVPLSQAQPADLVFFGTPAFYHHVGIYIGDGLFIEAPHTGDVVKVSVLAGRGCTLVCRYPVRLP
jgi:cell wall-associated NlpC family hydrolase